MGFFPDLLLECRPHHNVCMARPGGGCFGRRVWVVGAHSSAEPLALWDREGQRGGGSSPSAPCSGAELPKSVRIPNLNVVFRVVVEKVYLSRQKNTISFI